MQNELLNEVKAIIANVAGCKIEAIGEETNLLELGVDSLKALEVSVRLQKKLKIKIDPKETVNFQSPKAILELISKK